MAKTDWTLTDTVEPEDINDIGQEINHLQAEIRDRLDTADTSPVTLQPGLQIIHAEKDARFNLAEMQGRTLVTLLGDSGLPGEQISQWWGNEGTISVDAGNHTHGSTGLKVEIKDTNGSASKVVNSPLKVGKYYIFLCDAKNGNATDGVRVNIYTESPLTNLSGNTVTATDKFELSYLKYAPSADNSVFGANLNVQGESGQYGYFDAVRMYEITEDEYNEIDNMMADQLAAKYPFVPSGIIGVESPYLINTSGNLLPPFYEWTWLGSSAKKVEAPYQMTIDQKAADGWQFISYKVSVVANSNYFFTCNHNMKISIANGEGTESIVPYTEEQFIQFNSGTFTEISVYLSSIEIGSNVAYTLANPMLTIGSDPQPFQPQRKSMLAFQMELHANPMNGSEPDVLFKENGEHLKLAKWKKFVLGGLLDWNVDMGNVAPTYKPVYVRDGTISAVDYITYVTKYTGALLTNRITASYTGADQSLMYKNGIHITISNVDSGWGDDYIPTQDEIKAYFNGWKMYRTEGARVAPYNGVGTKGWYPISRLGDAFDATYLMREVPSILANNYDTWAPYNLLFRLAKETIEPVVTEGSLILSEGDNMVEVGTGIVLWERNAASVASNGVATFNGAMYPLKYRAALINALYKNSAHIYPDASGFRTPGTPLEISNGPVWASLNAENYDQSAAYSVTYIKLDKSQVVPITGTLAANEKTQISDLTVGVTEALQRVSVVEQKKEEKDAPGWIMPTLINGFYYNNLGVNHNGYYKDSSGRVWLSFALVGVLPQGTIMFVLPSGYRPRTRVYVSGTNANELGLNAQAIAITIEPSGEVYVAACSTGTTLASVIFDGSFLAEQ
ncbi:hypothetical protein [Paenibacillus senegalimassiliensis]|uniref:hypothetical protein n=1 Tax=Paenibacillus senegalimassiliensis TaxID=1737426 RepID=UPI00073E3978|nr:hypothetical protein [Paenibacillus senegalimassiliensis]